MGNSAFDSRRLVLTIVTSAVVSAACTAVLVLTLMPGAVAAQAARQQVSSLRLNQNGALRARIEAGRNSPDAAALTLRDQSEQLRIRLALAASHTPGQAGDLSAVDILDRDQRVRVHIGVDGDGSPFLQLLDGDGRVAWSAP
jgi:hypothetical protein